MLWDTSCHLYNKLEMEGVYREGNERKRSSGEAVPDRNVGIYFTHMLHL